MSAGLLLSAVLGAACMVVGTVVGDMVSEEIRGQLNRLPLALLRVARRRLPRHLRESLHDQEWEPELLHILTEAETRPVSRLFIGVRFSLGLIRSARSVGRARTGRAPQTESLRRLISITDACHLFGHLSTMAARLVLTFFLALTAGLELPVLLGIAGHRPLGSTALAAILTAVFGLLTGGILAALMGPGVQELIEGRLYRRRPSLWSTPELSPDHGWTISALRKLLEWLVGEEGDKARGTPLVSLTGAGLGAGLGLLAHTTLAELAPVVLFLGGAFLFLVCLRILLVETVLWWYERQRRQTSRNS